MPAAEAAATGADRVARTGRNTASALDTVAASGNRAGVAADRARVATTAYAGAATAAASANFNTAGSFDLITGKYDRNFAAITKNIQAMTGMQQSLRLTAREGLGFSRQFADIGVTAAMGMNPLMIAIQQGPQLFDILQEKAIATGVTVGAVIKGLGAQLWTALAPILPILLLIGAAIGAVAAAFGLGAREINKGNDDVLKGLGLTEEQLKRVKDQGVDTAVTIGDTFGAFFAVVGDRLKDAFEGPLKWLGDAWSGTLDFIVEYGSLAIKSVIGFFVGAVSAIGAAWKALPGALGGVISTIVNTTISGLELMINVAVMGLNKLISGVNSVSSNLGIDPFSLFDPVKLGRMGGDAASQMAKVGEDIGGAFSSGFKRGSDATGDFFTDVAAEARKRRDARIMEAAGDPNKGAGAKGDKSGSDRDPYADLVEGAKREIRTLEERINVLAKGEEATNRYDQAMKLLNSAREQDIKLTDRQVEELITLGLKLADLEKQMKDAEGFNEIRKGITAQKTALEQANAAIGVYGQELSRLKFEQQLLNEATAKGITLTPAYLAELKKSAAELAAIDYGNQKKQFGADNKKQFDDNIYMLERQRGEIGLTGAALASYRYETDLLAQARAKNITLGPQDLADVKAMAAQYGEAEDALRKYEERVAFQKDVFKGLFTDIRSGLAEGKSLWDAFGDAATNALNKIIDKLLDLALDAAFNALMSSAGGGGGGFANGGAFSGSSLGGNLQGFATGGTFTNSVVDSPTMFSYSRGLGVMGEAGPEAIMPLARGPDGSLGVQMQGGSSEPSMRQLNVTVENHNHISGAVSSADIVALNKATAEQTENTIKRNLPGWIDQLDRDGTL